MSLSGEELNIAFLLGFGFQFDGLSPVRTFDLVHVGSLGLVRFPLPREPLVVRREGDGLQRRFALLLRRFMNDWCTPSSAPCSPVHMVVYGRFTAVQRESSLHLGRGGTVNREATGFGRPAAGVGGGGVEVGLGSAWKGWTGEWSRGRGERHREISVSTWFNL